MTGKSSRTTSPARSVVDIEYGTPNRSIADVEQGIPKTSDSGPANNEQVFLLNSIQQAIPPKDFFVEIRGILDVEHLLDNAIVILDATETEIDVIIRRVVDEINPKRDTILYSDVEPKIFSYSDFSDLRVPSIRHKLQGVFVKPDNVVVDQSWLTIYCSIDGLFHRHIGFVRMNLPTNFGAGLGDVQFILLVIAPIVEKGTKTAFETARTFSTLLCDPALRQRLLDVHDSANFIQEINITVDRMAFQLPTQLEKKIEKVVHKKERWWPCKGIYNDFKRRWKCYGSDYTDGFADARAIQKTISSAVFLYFAILPTAIALGMLNDSNTHGLITVKKEILAQWIGGLFFGIFGGQLFLIMLSTAPISIYIEVIHQICENGGYDFFKMFTTTGLWCSAFLIIFAVFQFSAIMKYAKRSLEELFGLFISIALIYKAIQAIITTFQKYDPTCSTHDPLACDRSVGLLFIILLCGTLWISLTLYNFRTTPFLTKTKREILADYALPIGVIFMSFVGSFLFKDVPKETFTYDSNSNPINIVKFWEQSWKAHFICLALGIPLAVLFFMDQLIVTNTVDNTQNK
uniref:Bicarbonate transporter-like transmembrane domain-containing protein n=1 Tax=Panagrolaimus davidi TaxID=227884 RepID=A0A914QF56_9BILA